MKKTVSFIVLLLVMLGIAHSFDRGHVYIRGIVSDINEKEEVLSGEDEPLKTRKLKSITVSGLTYLVDPKCKVLLQYYEKNAYHERAVRFYDLRAGDSVYVKVIGAKANEIVVEGWKR